MRKIYREDRLNVIMHNIHAFLELLKKTNTHLKQKSEAKTNKKQKKKSYSY